jgi:hypothetical protein
MKRAQLIKHLNNCGAYLLREGSRQSIYQKELKKTHKIGAKEMLETEINFEPDAFMTMIDIPDPVWAAID